MSVTTFTRANFGALITRMWDGLDPKTSPFGVEFETKQGVLFDLLNRYFGFEEMVENATKVQRQPGDSDYEYEVARKDQLKRELAGGQIKITLKLEVEKYAG